MSGCREGLQAGTHILVIRSSLSRQERGRSIKRTIPGARRTCTQQGCRLLTTVANTYTSSETRAPSWHKPSLSGSFQQVRRLGLMPQTLGTAISDEHDLILHRASDLLDALLWQRVRNLHTPQCKWMVGQPEAIGALPGKKFPLKLVKCMVRRR